MTKFLRTIVIINLSRKWFLNFFLKNNVWLAQRMWVLLVEKDGCG